MNLFLFCLDAYGDRELAALLALQVQLLFEHRLVLLARLLLRGDCPPHLQLLPERGQLLLFVVLENIFLFLN